MNKKFYGTLLLGTLLLGSTIVSCKDYDDDIDNLQNQITQLATKADMQSEVSKLQSAVATAQAAAENKAAAAEQAAKDAAAKAQAAADAAAKAQGSADAAATVEALEKVAAEAAAAAKAAEDAKTAAEAKAAELEAQLAELQALAATLVSTEDFEAAKKDLNDKYAELAAKIGETTGVTGMTGINLVGVNKIAAGYGVWAGVRDNMQAAEWDGPKAETINAIEKGTKLAAWGVKDFTFSVNPTDFDASKIEAFAIVNQFDEVAPIAFGTPKAVTRAAAGAWTLPVLGNAIYGEKAAEFEKNFSKEANKPNGSMATLVAGQFAGALADEFCTVEKNENKDKSSFKTEVAYNKIDGVVELNVEKPQYVFDAYIVKLAGAMEGSVAHDSIVYKLAYTGTTLTYDAATVKKFVDSKGANQTLKVTVKQINLNGYIHTADYEITFKAKEDADNIKAETVLVSKVDHQVVINVLDKSTGKPTDLQKQTAGLSEALTEWGIDLSKKDAESTIHWMHTSLPATATVGEVYYYKADETKEGINKDLISSAKLKKDSETGQLSVEFAFKKDYQYTNWDAKTNDAAWQGKKIYVELSFTGTDTDATESTNTDYKVIVPIQFQTIDATQYYNWNNKKLQSAPGKIEYTYTTGGAPLANFSQILNISDQFMAVDGSGVTLTTADTTQVFGGTPSAFKYVQPALSLSGALSIKEYTDKKAAILALEEGKTPTALRYTVLNTTDGNTNSTSIDQVFKDKEIAVLNQMYMNAVSIETESATNQHYATRSQYNWNSTSKRADTWNEILVCDPTYIGSRTWMTQTYGDFVNYKTDEISLVLWNKNVTACLNAEYAVNGLKVSIAGREVNAPLSVKLSYNAPAASVPTLVTSAKLANTTNASILLSNSEFAPVTASNFDGTFTLKTAEGKKLAIDPSSALGATIKTAALNADGSIPTSAAAYAGTSAISVTSVLYDYAANVKASALQFTMNNPVAPGAEKKLAVKLTISESKLFLAGTSTAIGSGNLDFYFILELQ